MLISLNISCPVKAQTDPILGDSDIHPFTASGSIGLSANMYNAWGIENRRAPASFQANANTNFSLFGFSSGLNLLYSTDQSALRQNLNSISFNATWSWLTVQAGDVSPNFSKYGINGATIRGGYIKIAPGNWQAELSGGRSKRRVKNNPGDGFRQASFERWTAATKVGYETGNNHYYLSSQYSLDKNSSLSNSGDVTPQENLTVTPDVKVTFFDEALTMAAQVTASAFTRDLNSPKVPIGAVGVPAFLGGIIQAHTSSRINYAGEISTSLSIHNFGLELGYERIQPGFTSLGVGRVRDDQQKIRIAPSVQLLNNRLNLQGNVGLGRDNLSGSRLETQKNTTIGTNAQLSLTDQLNISANYNLLINDVSSNGVSGSSAPQGVALGQTQVAHTVMLQPTLSFQQEQLTHTISLTGSFYTLTNTFKGSQAAELQKINSDTYSTAVSYSLAFSNGFAINGLGNFLVNNSNSSKNTSIGANIGATYSLFDQKLTLNFNAGLNQNKNETNRSGVNNFTTKSRQIMFNLMGNYRLTGNDSFSLSIRNRNNSVLQQGGSTYSELEGSFNYQHRF